MPLHLSFALLGALGITCHMVYQIFFHPLAKYPGPFLAKISILRAVYKAWKGDIHIDIWKQHEKYGPVVRYGPDWLLFNTIQGYKDIYGNKDNIRKHNHLSRFNPRAPNLFTISDKTLHRKQRHDISKAFSMSYMKGFQARVVFHTTHLCRQIDSLLNRDGMDWSKPLNMSRWGGYLVFDILTDFLLSRSYNLLGSADHRPITYHTKSHMLRLAVCSYFPLLALLRLDKLLFKDATKSTAAFWRWVKSAITERRQHPHASDDLFTTIQLAKQSNPCTDVEVQSELGMFLAAGFDTTTTALCALFFYLGMNESEYDQLRTEIRSKFDRQQDICLGSQLQSCVYLHACIKEALRISPPVGSALWREVGPCSEIIDGIVIPPGFSVGTAAYSMHHNEAHFADACEFRPKRWLTDQSANNGCAAFVPFSTGPRSCIGRSLAITELSLTMAILIWRYDFRVASGEGAPGVERQPLIEKFTSGRNNPKEFQLIDRVIGHPDGPSLEFRLRDGVDS